MSYTALSDAQCVVAKIDPVSQAAGTVTLGWVDLKKFNRVQFVLQAGALGASATLDAVVKQATDSSGTSSKNLATSKAITQLTQAGSGSNKVVVVNVSGTDLDTNNGFEFAALSITVGTAASQISAVALGEPESTPPVAGSGGVTTTQVV